MYNTFFKIEYTCFSDLAICYETVFNPSLNTKYNIFDSLDLNRILLFPDLQII